MTRIPQELADSFSRIAFEMRERWSQDGHDVETALDINPVFRRNRRPESSLSRMIIEAGFAAGASKEGLPAGSGAGGSLQISTTLYEGTALFRLRSARRASDGTFRIIANEGSSWSSPDDDALIREYRFVFGYTMSGDALGDIFVASVDGIVPSTVDEMLLGDVRILGDNPHEPRDFPTDPDEGLPGFGDDAVGDERSA